MTDTTLDSALYLAQHGLLLAAGATALLTIGCGCLWLTRSPVHRQRVGELTLLAVLAWIVLASVPLPRLDLWSQGTWAAPPAERDSLVVEVNSEPWNPDLAASLPVMASTDANPVVGEPFPQDVSPLDYEWAASLPVTAPAHASPVVSQTPALDVDSPITRRSLPLPAVAVAAYALGACGAAAWLLVGLVLLWGVRWTSRRPEPWLLELWRNVAATSHGSPPQLIVSQGCSRPLSWGVVWPAIALPHGLCRPDNKGQLQTVLLHELGHVVQRDAWGNFLLCLALPLLYWNPLYWWLRSQMQLCAELVADDWAAEQVGKQVYVEDLVALAKATRSGGLPLWGVTGVFSSPSQFYRRMQMLLVRETSLARSPSASWRVVSLAVFGLALFLATVLAGVRPAPAQAPPEAEAAPPAVGAPAAVPAPMPPTVGPVPATPPVAGAPALPPTPFPPVAPVPLGLPTVPAPPAPAVAPPARIPLSFPTLEPSSDKDSLKSLEAEREQLIRRIKELQDKLDAIARQAPGGVGIAPPSKTPRTIEAQPSGNITLHRVDEFGDVWAEVWQLENGKPVRVIEKKRAGTAKRVSAEEGPKPTAAPPADEPAADPRPTKAAPSASNSPYQSPVPRIPTYPYPKADDRPSVGPVPVPAGPPAQPPAEANSFGGSKQLDLVSLATSYADAVSAVESAKAKLAEFDPQTSAFSKAEISTAKVTLQNAQRKEQLLRRIATVALAGAKQEFEFAMSLVKKGYAGPSVGSESKARVEILEQILSTQAGADSTDPAAPKK